jgi:hypothetical protein
MELVPSRGFERIQPKTSIEELASAARDGRDEEDAVTFLERAGFPAEEADVFFI